MAKDARIYLRLSEKEKEMLKEKAKEAKQSVTQYILSLAENKKIIVVDGIPELTKQIMKLGVNINQIAKVANSQKEVQDYYLARISEYQLKIISLLDKLIQAVVVEENKSEENNGGQ